MNVCGVIVVGLFTLGLAKQNVITPMASEGSLGLAYLAYATITLCPSGMS